MYVLLLLPNTLFESHDIIKQFEDSDEKYEIIIYENPKFFTEYSYHKLKLIFHRATMKSYYNYIQKSYKKANIKYVEFDTNIKPAISKYEKIYMYDPIDFSIEKTMKKICGKKLNILESKLFILTNAEIDEYLDNSKGTYFNATFYKWIRQKKDILMNGKKPIGGSWSFDVENRLQFPKSYKEKPIKFYDNLYIKEAKLYVEKHFKNNIGETSMYLPINHSDAKIWLKKFIKERLLKFGPYEDAIDKDVVIGFHSGISALLNIGLLNPSDVIESALKYKNKVPIQSLEGFIRQIISWREYVRMLYIKEHTKFIKNNFLKHTRKLKDSWYDGTTGIVPVDECIKKALKYAYCHHIERLMILGNVMLLSMIKPTDVYKWFLEVVSIDAYEWVMEPNVYGMSQHSVGQLMMNRPYFSSSNYIFKMSSYKKSDENEKIKLDKEYEWYEILDALYYNFIIKHKTYLKSIYSTANSVYILNKKSQTEKTNLKKLAEAYLKKY